MATRLDLSFYDWDRFRKHNPITKYEDIEIGKLYHIPPTIIYGRRDFIPENKTNAFISGKMREEGANCWESATIYRTELTARFIVEVKKF